MNYGGTNYPALDREDPLYKVKDYTDALREALMTPAVLANINLNDLQTSGTYYQSSNSLASKANNFPIDNCSGLVEIVNRSTITHQKVWAYATNRHFARVRIGNSWTVWRELTTTVVP